MNRSGFASRRLRAWNEGAFSSRCASSTGSSSSSSPTCRRQWLAVLSGSQFVRLVIHDEEFQRAALLKERNAGNVLFESEYRVAEAGHGPWAGRILP